MPAAPRIIVALSGGVDSAVAALLLSQRGYDVECLHMSNWVDDDGYCTAAADLQDARRVCARLGLVLHQVDFSGEYRESVFEDFLCEIRAGRSPNPDVHCNREIKFGAMRRYARRLGADRLATGHYARLDHQGGLPVLLKAMDPSKDQSYFLSAVQAADFVDVEFPLGSLSKTDVRRIALEAGLTLAAKRDSTGICFIGERPFAAFLERFIEPAPGPIVTLDGATVGEHQGLHRYTLGQRRGIGIGGVEQRPEDAWYVADKRSDHNELVVVQGRDHPALYCDWIEAGTMHWIGARPEIPASGLLRCHVKIRYRQPDQVCELSRIGRSSTRVTFAQPQRAVTPGQFAVFYLDQRCIGSARIERAGSRAAGSSESREAC
jgi:tRNA-specific 2-thiouridylase